MRLLLVAALFVSSVSFGQASAGAKEKREPKTEVIFGDGDDVLGKTVGPDGVMIQGDPPRKFPSMIRLRENFADKLRESVNELR